MIARHRDGRVIKVEGNPDHPIGRGALCARGQAALGGLYDPDRVETPLRRRAGGGFDPISWDEAIRLAGERLKRAAAAGPDRVAVLAGLEAGTLADLESAFTGVLGSRRYHIYEALSYEPLRAAMELCFGLDIVPRVSLAGADFILALGADFLDTWISPVAATGEFALLRRPEAGRPPRFVYAGARLTLTAANADRRTFVRPGGEAALALALLGALLRSERELLLAAPDRARLLKQVGSFTPERVAARTGLAVADISAMAQELVEARAPVVLAGSPLAAGAAAKDAAAAALLATVAAGGAVRIRRHALSRAARAVEIKDLVAALGAGAVDVLLVRGTNPLYSLGPATGFAAALERGPWIVALASHLDETAARADLVLPVHTPLEAWGDHEAEDGVVGLAQPAMGPVAATRHAGDVWIALAAAAAAPLALGDSEDFAGHLRARWAERHAASGDERPFPVFFRAALERGGVFAPAAAPPPLAASPALPLSPALAAHVFGAAEEAESACVLHAFPSVALYDGRGANKGWLQELPDPVTKVTWNTWLEMHPESARAHGFVDGERIEVRGAEGAIVAPLRVHAGIAPGLIAVPLGQGHAAYGRAAAGRGANPFVLLAPPWTAAPAAVQVRGLRGTERLARTAPAFDLDARPGIAPVVPATAGGVLPDAPPFLLPLPESITPETDFIAPHEHRAHRWAMVIDVNACTGCSACVTACYAENNIPVVGEDAVRAGREMAWLSLHRFDVPPADPAPEATTHVFLPMLCQHCEAAPCEPVCPTFAAHHTDEGLNGQVYSRCVGTRYCANNCPYKVRRFNWQRPDFPAPLTWQLNPDVTVRDQGVMEKCTFCVQRIAAGKQGAARAGRPLAAFDIVPACAETCPARAIVFGDLLDPESEVSRLTRGHPRRYQVLGALGTRPAVTYLAKVRSGPA
jgi:molybdopterin-containing oxidoreductase family iron-sulfur binding subunit